jgi:hypothetical protein
VAKGDLMDPRTERLARTVIRTARMTLQGLVDPDELARALAAFEDGDGGWIEWTCGRCGEQGATRVVPDECPSCGEPRSVKAGPHAGEPAPVGESARRVLREYARAHKRAAP